MGAPARVEIVELAPGDLAPLEALDRLLIDSVEGGASIGFLEPLAPAVADAWWRGVLAAVGPDLRIWLAWVDGAIVGTVQLARCEKENGRHRAEVRKLLVRRAARGRGIASVLMARLESAAREMGLTLLHLDTETDSDADRVYAHLGWTRMGVLPAYAGTPDGVLRDCSFWYRRLDAP